MLVRLSLLELIGKVMCVRGSSMSGNEKIRVKNELGTCASVKRWTKIAEECYFRGCACRGCYYEEFFLKSNQRCKMKATVLELVKVLGKPKGDEECQKQMII